MKQHNILALVSAAAIGFAQTLKVAQFSDVHILPNYNPSANNTCYCTKECTGTQKINPDVASSAYAPLGKIYCDGPYDMVEGMFQKLNLEIPDLDILFVSGDIVGHTYAQDVKGNYSQKLYDTLMEVHKNFSLLAAQYLPKAIVLPTLGNNDFKYTYQTPSIQDKNEFF